GMRIKVTRNNVPLTSVPSIQVKSQTGRQTFTRQNTLLVNVPPPLPIFANTPLEFKYHAEFGAITSPNQRLTGNYRITVRIRDGRKTLTRYVNFNTTTCTFNGNLVVNF